MGKYIDKDAVMAEIEKLKDESIDLEDKSRWFLSAALKNRIKSLEVKEVDLEKEIDNVWNPHFNLGWDEKSLLSVNHEGFTTIAKHFFELGMQQSKNYNNNEE